VTAVRLLVNGAPLNIAGVAKVQPIRSWPQFDPEAPPTSSGALGSDGGRIVGIGSPVPPALAHGQFDAATLTADGTTVAALRTSRGRTTVLVGPGTGPLRARFKAASVSALSVDPGGDLLFATGIGAASRLLEVPSTGAVRRVAVPRAVRDRGISALAISRDGSRIAMIVGPPGSAALVVGAMTEDHGAQSVVGPAVVIPGADDAQGVAWAGANTIVTTVRVSAQRRGVIETTVDGYQPRALTRAGLPSDPTQVAAAPGQPVLAVADGAVWRLVGALWIRVRDGSDPSYAG
jgi:hypothetical protein